MTDIAKEDEEMLLKHRVKISLSDGGKRAGILEGGEMKIPRWIAKLLFGEGMKVLVITPGETVSSVEIQEVGNQEVAKEGRLDGHSK